MERLLYRLAVSGHATQFVLKGAMLLAVWHDIPGRPTRDLDLLGYGAPTPDRLRQVFTDACQAPVPDDGLRLADDTLATEVIRDGQEYHGVRVRLRAFLGPARIALQVDVGFGDALTPPPAPITYPTLLDFPAPRLLAYHPATVVAEKINAMIVLGFLNTRMKDFYDLHVLLRHLPLDHHLLVAATRATFARRRVPIPHELPSAFTPEFLSDCSK